MSSSIGKKDYRKIITFMLIILMATTMFPMVANADSDPLNVTDKVKYDSFDLYKCDYMGKKTVSIIEKGQTVDPVPQVKIGDYIGLKYYWNISESNMKTVTSGSFFTVDLPADIKFESLSDSAEVKTPSGTVLGKMALSGTPGSQQLTVTLNETAAKSVSLKNGWLMIFGNVSQANSTTSNASIFGVELPIYVDPPGGGTTPGGGTNMNPGDSSSWDWGGNTPSEFSKGSSNPERYTGLTKFYLYVNKLMSKYKFEGNDQYEVRKNVIIEDKLQDGITYSGNLKISTAFYYAKGVNTTNAALDPVSPTALSNKQIGDTVYLQDQLTLCTPPDITIPYDEFKEFIENSGPLTYGVWQNKALVINLGDLEGQMTFNDITWGDLKDRVASGSQIVTRYVYERDQDGKAIIDPGTNKPKTPGTVTFQAITPKVKENTLKAYASFFGVPKDKIASSDYDNNKGKVVGMDMSFDTTISGTDRLVTNTAFMQFGGEKTASNETKVNFVQMGGGADFDAGAPGDVRLVKLDDSTYAPLEGVQFKLQKYNKSTEEYEDLPDGEHGSGIFTTDKDGSILFKNLDWGKYRFVEVKGLDGYTSKITFKDGDGTFELVNPKEVFEFIAFNYKDEVLGNEEFPDDSGGDVQGEQSVLGDEAKTGDMNNFIPLLATIAIVLLVLIAAAWINRSRKE